MNENTGNVIFSPTRPNTDDVDIETGLPSSSVFNYPSSILTNNLDNSRSSSAKGTPNKRALPEEIPMLVGQLANYDSDTETHQLPQPSTLAQQPKAAARASPAKYSTDYRQQLQSAKDSYVNVPATNNRFGGGGGANDAVSNPGYVVVGGGKTNETRT